MTILKSRFYLLRENGCGVPLVAVDELPHNFQIEGVPRTLTLEEASTMICVPGKHESRNQIHRVIDANRRSATTPTIPNCHNVPSNRATPALPSCEGYSNWKKSYGIEEQNPDISNSERMVKSNRSTSVQKTAEPDGFDPIPAWKDTSSLGERLPPPGKKVYCSHWMSTGECDYAQQGCLYKHVMPLDLTTLNHLGFQDIPKWYREKHGIGKLTAVPGICAPIQGSAKQSSLMQSNWRSRGYKNVRLLKVPSFPASPGPEQHKSTTGPVCHPNTPQHNLLDFEPIAGTGMNKFKARTSKHRDLYAKIAANKSVEDTAGSEIANSAESVGDHPTSGAKAGILSDNPPTSVTIQFGIEQNNSPSDVVSRFQPEYNPFHNRPALTASSTSSQRTAEPQDRAQTPSVATDYEEELASQIAERDASEAEEYANVKASFTNKEE